MIVAKRNGKLLSFRHYTVFTNSICTWTGPLSTWDSSGEVKSLKSAAILLTLVKREANLSCKEERTLMQASSDAQAAVRGKCISWPRSSTASHRRNVTSKSAMCKRISVTRVNREIHRGLKNTRHQGSSFDKKKLVISYCRSHTRDSIVPLFTQWM